MNEQNAPVPPPTPTQTPEPKKRQAKNLPDFSNVPESETIKFDEIGKFTFSITTPYADFIKICQGYVASAAKRGLKPDRVRGTLYLLKEQV